MKKFSTGIFVVGCLAASTAALAESQTISVGYAQSKLQRVNTLRGINVQYRYETNTPFGVLTSATYQKGSKDYMHANEDVSESAYDQNKAFSVQVGPVYRLNSIASMYTTIGYNHTKATQKYAVSANSGAKFNTDFDTNSRAFAYGAGVIINPVSNLSVNIGYEGSRAYFTDYRAKLNGFNVGMGYRF